MEPKNREPEPVHLCSGPYFCEQMISSNYIIRLAMHENIGYVAKSRTEKCRIDNLYFVILLFLGEISPPRLQVLFEVLKASRNISQRNNIVRVFKNELRKSDAATVFINTSSANTISQYFLVYRSRCRKRVWWRLNTTRNNNMYDCEIIANFIIFIAFRLSSPDRTHNNNTHSARVYYTSRCRISSRSRALV